MFIENAGLTFVVKKKCFVRFSVAKICNYNRKDNDKINVLQVFNLQKVIIMYK